MVEITFPIHLNCHEGIISGAVDCRPSTGCLWVDVDNWPRPYTRDSAQATLRSAVIDGRVGLPARVAAALASGRVDVV